MKRSFLILAGLLVSLSAWAQTVDLDVFMAANPEYSTRIIKAKEFLNKTMMMEDNYTATTCTKSFYGKNDVIGKLHLYRNKRVVMILKADKPNTDIKFSVSELPEEMIPFITMEQQKGRILTDVLNLTNSLGKDGRIIQSVDVPVKYDESTEEITFKGPIAVLVTMSPLQQIELEDMMFKTMPVEYLLKIMEDGQYKDAYNSMIDRRDFRYMLLKYTGAADKFTSDLILVQRMMVRIYKELGSEYKRLDPESVRVLSNPLTRELISKVSLSPGNADLEVFHTYMEYWCKVFSACAMDEIWNPEKDKYEAFPEELRKKELEFNVSFRQKVGNYILTNPVTQGMMGK
jgi:hypothetical protein